WARRRRICGSARYERSTSFRQEDCDSSCSLLAIQTDLDVAAQGRGSYLNWRLRRRSLVSAPGLEPGPAGLKVGRSTYGATCSPQGEQRGGEASEAISARERSRSPP